MRYEFRGLLHGGAYFRNFTGNMFLAWLDGIPQKEVIEEDWTRELLRQSSARETRWRISDVVGLEISNGI